MARRTIVPRRQLGDGETNIARVLLPQSADARDGHTIGGRDREIHHRWTGDRDAGNLTLHVQLGDGILREDSQVDCRGTGCAWRLLSIAGAVVIAVAARQAQAQTEHQQRSEP